MEIVEQHKCFGGEQYVYQHQSDVLKCSMKFSIFIPEHRVDEKLPVVYWLSGLTCNEQNFINKAGAQQYAAQYKMILVAPDTSPRGEEIADDAAYDLGQGAGFYLNATQAPWSAHYQMYSYIIDELIPLINSSFPSNAQQGIMGHSMGGHGALTIGLKHPDIFKSISAFSPIVAPSQVAWGKKAFTAYLGSEQATWADYDAVELIRRAQTHTPILVDQGSSDPFLQEQLKPELLSQVCKEKAYPITLNMREGYDHSYYFIASFIEEHLRFHHQFLRG